MSTIYIPVPIESAEQAEALPVGTVALVRDDTEEAVAAKTWSDVWRIAGYWPDYPNSDAVGWTALVPIEAEEEMDTDYYTGGDGSPVRRLVTPWEYA